MDVGALIGVICGVLGVVAVVVAIAVYCMRKRRHAQNRRSTGGSTTTASLLHQSQSQSHSDRETSLSNRPVRLSNGNGRQSGGSINCAPSYIRQVSATSGESQATTTTPLAPATPAVAATIDMNGQGAVRETQRPQRADMRQSDTRNAPRSSGNSNSNNNYNGYNYGVFQPPVPYNAPTYTAFPYGPAYPAYQPYVPYAGPYAYAEHSTPSRPEPQRIVPLMSTDLFMTRKNPSGELLVARLDELTSTAPGEADPERSSVDYQRDLDGAVSGFNSLPRRHPNPNQSPTHRTQFNRSASHSLHSISRSQSQTPSILEEPEPPSESDDEHDYVNVHGVNDPQSYIEVPPPVPQRIRSLPNAADNVPPRPAGRHSADTRDLPPRRPPKPARRDVARTPTAEDDSNEDTLRQPFLPSDMNDNVLKSASKYRIQNGSSREQQSFLPCDHDLAASARSASLESSASDEKRDSKTRKVFEVAL